MKGWVFIQPYAEYLEATHQSGASKPETFILLNQQSSSIDQGAFPVTYAIKSGNFLRVFAEHEAIKIGANFNIKNNVPGDNNGTYEIKGGRLDGSGIFINVAAKEETDFGKLFICHSNTPDGLHLRWEVGLDEIVNDENITYV
jgi:hypothetical protein